MGKRKRMIARAVPALFRHLDMKAEMTRRGVRTIYDLPVRVHLEFRAMRLAGV